jgi:hypothetical protein
MTKARDLADLGNKTSLDEINDAYDAGTLSNRNMIINGGLLCWQRGISHGSGGGIVYTADRFWKYSPSVSGTYERSTDAPDGFAYSMHYNVDGSTAGSGTTVEFSRQGYFPQGQYTFSFYVKGDLTNTNLGIGFRNSVGSGTDQVNFSPITNYGNYTDWTRVVRTFTINLDPHANNKFLNLEFAGMPAGVKFTGVQLELGDTATPFEHRSFGDELAKCQRYYYKHIDGDTSQVGIGDHWSATQLDVGFSFPVTMRATPTLIQSGGSDHFESYGGSEIRRPTGNWQLWRPTVTRGSLYAPSNSNVTPGFATRVLSIHPDAFLGFDAEL